MAARGHTPSAFEGRSIQAPGMMRHGPVPNLGPASRLPMETLPPPELLEKKAAIQGAEMDWLARENQRLAESHGVLRQELLAAQQEMQRLQAHAGRVQAESDIQIRGFMDKISKMEAEIKAGVSIKKELQQAHLEAQSLFGARQELTAQIQQATEELQKTHSEIKKLPEMHAELDGLMQEHQKLRVTFEQEKSSNMELVQQMHVMEKNLIAMAREVEKLRAEVQNAEKRAHAPNPYQNMYTNADAVYTSVGQGIAYADGAYAQAGIYPNSGYGQGGMYANGGFVQGTTGNYADPYGRAQVHMPGAAQGEAINQYAASAAVAYDPSRAGVGVSSGVYEAARAGTSVVGAYDATRAGLGAGAGVYDASRAGFGVAGAQDAARGGTAAAAAPDAARGSGVNATGAYDPARGAQTSAQR